MSPRYQESVSGLMCVIYANFDLRLIVVAGSGSGGILEVDAVFKSSELC